jgi:hypothetical protein
MNIVTGEKDGTVLAVLHLKRAIPLFLLMRLFMCSPECSPKRFALRVAMV